MNDDGFAKLRAALTKHQATPQQTPQAATPPAPTPHNFSAMLRRPAPATPPLGQQTVTRAQVKELFHADIIVTVPLTTQKPKYDTVAADPIGALRSALVALEANIENADMVRQNTAFIISITQRVPGLADHLLTEDFGLLVKALQKILKVAEFTTQKRVSKKLEKAEKTAQRQMGMAKYFANALKATKS